MTITIEWWHVLLALTVIGYLASHFIGKWEEESSSFGIPLFGMLGYIGTTIMWISVLFGKLVF